MGQFKSEENYRISIIFQQMMAVRGNLHKSYVCEDRIFLFLLTIHTRECIVLDSAIQN